MKIFKDTPLDAISVLVTLVAGGIPFGIALGVTPWAALAFIVLANLHLNGPMHYHIHRPMFVSRSANRVYELLCTSVALVGYQEYKFIHLEHHKHVNDVQVNGLVNDPVSIYRWGNGTAEPFFSYVIKSSFRNVMQGRGLVHKNVTLDTTKSRQELGVKIATVLFLLFIDVSFIPLYALMIYSTWALNWALSYCEHYAAIDCGDPKKDSVSCYSKMYNLLLFNTGYHQEHHYRPGIHWAKLPTIQKQLPTDRRVVNYTLFNNNPFLKEKV
jgi:fatty acid desaturase